MSFRKIRRAEAPSEDDPFEVLRKELEIVPPAMPQPGAGVVVLRAQLCEHGRRRNSCTACRDWTTQPTGQRPYPPMAA